MDSVGFKAFLNLELMLGKVIPAKWVGIKEFSQLDLVVREGLYKQSQATRKTL